MARFPDDLLDGLKRDVSLVRLVEGSGVELKKHGKDYLGRCPFHDDRTPSLVVSPESNLWHCLGACGTGGSVIDWVMKVQGVSFRHAVELLRDDPSVLAAGVSAPIKKATVPKLDAPVNENADDQAALRQVIGYYHQTLKQSPEALAYLKQRGLDDAALIDQFQLGYANRTLGLRLPQKNRKAGAAIREQLQRIGIYRDSGHEHFNGSLVIPVQDDNGVISGVYGRKLLDNLREGTPKHSYLPGPHRGVFNIAGFKYTEEVILCEALMDALTFWRWGFRHVTSSYGINGFTDEILQALVAHQIKRVLIAYDRDEAGDKAAVDVAKKLNAHGIDCFRLLFPKGMDANEYALKISPPQKSLALVIRKAEWLGSGKAPVITTVAADAEWREALPSLAAAVAESEPAPMAPPEALSTEPASVQHLNTQATPVPALPSSGVSVQAGDNELFITLGDRDAAPRIYRVRGLEQNRSADQLKIQLLVKRAESFHMDKLDLYSSKQRQVFINQACVELGVQDEVLKKDLGKVLLALEEQQSQNATRKEDKTPADLEPAERTAALELLHDPALLQRILTDFNSAGVVGEETNKLTGYLACVSRKLDKPLALMIQSSSAAGKSSLMDAILALMPEEERIQYSAMTGQSLFYMGQTNLKNKILAISEEEGAHNASYALKLLQSEGEVTIASTGKDESTGNLITKEYTVEGPVMLFMTTTAIDIDEELLNRCLVLTVNESREQTQAIHAAQRQKRTLQGLQHKLEKDRLIQLHRNAQRLLKPLAIINPYADQLTFLDDKTRTRRDHEKYLTLIDSIALLHQYQREIKTIEHNGQRLDYIEVTLEDIDTANRLAHEILGKTLDELPPQTRKLLKEIQHLVQCECKAQGIEQKDFRFSRRQVRQLCGWSETQIRLHMQRLVSMEYLLIHRGGRGQSFEYELLYQGEGEQGDTFLMGLLDVEQLQKTGKKAADDNGMTATSRGESPHLAGPSRPQCGPVADVEKPLHTAPAVTLPGTSRVNGKSASLAV